MYRLLQLTRSSPTPPPPRVLLLGDQGSNLPHSIPRSVLLLVLLFALLVDLGLLSNYGLLLDLALPGRRSTFARSVVDLAVGRGGRGRRGRGAGGVLQRKGHKADREQLKGVKDTFLKLLIPERGFLTCCWDLQGRNGCCRKTEESEFKTIRLMRCFTSISNCPSSDSSDTPLLTNSSYHVSRRWTCCLWKPWCTKASLISLQSPVPYSLTIAKKVASSEVDW
jgi:hypothetical protein